MRRSCWCWCGRARPSAAAIDAGGGGSRSEVEEGKRGLMPLRSWAFDGLGVGPFWHFEGFGVYFEGDDSLLLIINYYEKLK